MQYLLKIRGGVWFCANNGKFPVDGGDAVMISFLTSKERNLSRLWDSSDEIIKDSIYSAHDSQLEYYPYTKQELITNSSHHFYYRGMKFVSLDVLLKMKLRRHEWPKDFKDIVRMYLCKVRVFILDKLVGFRWIV